MGKGTGDLYIKGICSIIFSEIYVKDAWLYIQNPTRSEGLNIELPSKAVISYTMKHVNNGGVSLLLQDGSHNYYIGNWSSTGSNGVLVRNIGSTQNLVSQTLADLSYNVEHTISCKYDNGTWEYNKDNDKKTFSANYTPTKLVTIDITSNTQSYMKDLLIMKL